ncbi:FUSC family protein [Actinopolymorpha singaporensis]|uniref:Fusaric acid resistance protein-like n=1 Tax=Actinopolymorpha singaporensis TaxID=117157 RepID=A0A1H1UIN3_9ACTN|nr:FUSC family protein [Actinopolymorpha singaporensis]SDS72066.1 Fusaric acid resistance protein-like [Actinopolymorpha singaporensis]
MIPARALGDAALRRLRDSAWPVLQQAAAAIAAWVIARNVVEHRQPFFAPIAAVVALNASGGERGSNAVRLLLGVVAGIVVAELTMAVLGGGYLALAVAVLVAMLLAVVLGGQRLVIAQAAAGAILTVAIANGEVGFQRLTDALIGAGVALVISQLLFPTEPVGLLRRAEAGALKDMAAELGLSARWLESGGEVLAGSPMDRSRQVLDRLADLARIRENSRRVARRSTTRWGSTGPVIRECENAGRLDVLGADCLTLTRMAGITSCDQRRRLGPVMRELAGVLAALATDLGDRLARQHAADRALAVARALGSHQPDGDTGVWEVAAAFATDIVIFAGVDPEHAAAAVRKHDEDLQVRTPPHVSRLHFRRRRQRARRDGD